MPYLIFLRLRDHYGYLPADICRVALSLFINRRNWVVPANFIALVGDEIKVFIDVLGNRDIKT